MDRKKGTTRKSSPTLALLRYFLCFLAGGAVVYTQTSTFGSDDIITPVTIIPSVVVPSQTSESSSRSSPSSSNSHVESINLGQPSLAIKSLHPKWKLWNEMTTSQQVDALNEVLPYVEKYGKIITKGIKEQGRIIHGNDGSCVLDDFGIPGGHQLCGPAPDPANCNFISFGINDDPSFDKAIADQWKCRGFAGDPTVNHPSRLHPKVTFHNLGATLLFENEERQVNKGGSEEWWSTSMPSLQRFLKLDHIDILKLDCEGCEVALSRDILQEDPNFLRNVDQLSLETHVTRYWINSTEHLYYFALQFPLLEEAGHVLEWSSIFGCNKHHEKVGCIPELEATGFPCGYRWRTDMRGTVGRSCQDFLWRRKQS